MKKVILLEKNFSKIIIPKAPFNFDATVHKPAFFPTPDNFWEKGKYWQTMRLGKKALGFKLENKGTIKRPKVKISVFSKSDLAQKEKEQVLGKINWQFGFNENFAEFYKKFKKDKILSPLFKKYLGMRPNSGSTDLYTSLQIYIVLQNATVRRTVQMTNNLLENYGKKVKFDKKELYVFWTPDELNKATEQDLRDLKLGYRAKFLKRIAQDFVKGKINEQKIKNLEKEQAKKEIIKIYGIGPASADYMLFEVFRRYNAFDYLPPWEQKILSRLIYKKKLVSASKILKDADSRWGKWKKLAIHYIFEHIFWQRKTQKIDWLEKEIRL